MLRGAFEWDVKKDADNIIKHGISFAEAAGIFEGVVFTAEDARREYGEVRYLSVGAVEGIVILVVAHTYRNGVTRIISARKAKRKERVVYYEHLEKTTKGT